MRTHRQSGFTLIEAMIAVVIFSVGLLAVASLQVVARKANFEAVQRTAASHLAQGLLERMRANRLALATYVGGGERVLGNNSMGALANTCQDRGSPCLAPALAIADLWDWERLLDGNFEMVGGAGVGGLAFPTACVRGNGAGATGAYTIAIAWRGATEWQEPPPDNCGSGNAAAYGGSDEFRRVVVVRTFINAL